MKELIERFYNSIRFGKPVPIPYREIILTAKIMDEIFAQIYPKQTTDDKPLRMDADHALAMADRGFGLNDAVTSDFCRLLSSIFRQ